MSGVQVIIPVTQWAGSANSCVNPFIYRPRTPANTTTLPDCGGPECHSSSKHQAHHTTPHHTTPHHTTPHTHTRMLFRRLFVLRQLQFDRDLKTALFQSSYSSP